MKRIITKHYLLHFFDVHLTGVLGFILRSLIHGAVVKILYNWFVDGKFTIIHYNPSWLEFSGIYLLIIYIKHDYRVRYNGHVFQFEFDNRSEETTRKEQVKQLYLKIVFRSAAALLAGGVLKLLILYF